MLFTSHDLGSVAGIADRITVLYRMSVAELDTAQAVVQRRRHPYSRLWRRRRPPGQRLDFCSSARPTSR